MQIQQQLMQQIHEIKGCNMYEIDGTSDYSTNKRLTRETAKSLPEQEMKIVKLRSRSLVFKNLMGCMSTSIVEMGILNE